ncbi:hypothetical protein AO735_08625 [Pseudomonas sp. TTU2014-096BSC]|nr:hypothetical protein AO735_08625 [Pseudomonas sp. TTU2014-096BSC]
MMYRLLISAVQLKAVIIEDHMKPITISKEQLEVALPKVKPGLQKYWAIQEKVRRDTSGFTDPELRRSYNGFYRVRRGQPWQSIYFDLMHQAQTNTYGFSQVLRALHQSTGRYEASFASKLVATLDNTQPVIDSVVLKNLGCKLATVNTPNRMQAIESLHRDLQQNVQSFLALIEGQALVSAFKAAYPTFAISEEKMVDLVLWQMR